MAAKAQTAAQTFVLVHGCLAWRLVLEPGRGPAARRRSPRVHADADRLGERKHLLSKDITLDTFTTDIVNVIEAEELSDIILVGHSFAATRSAAPPTRSPARSAIWSIWIR